MGRSGGGSRQTTNQRHKINQARTSRSGEAEGKHRNSANVTQVALHNSIIGNFRVAGER